MVTLDEYVMRLWWVEKQKTAGVCVTFTNNINKAVKPQTFATPSGENGH